MSVCSFSHFLFMFSPYTTKITDPLSMFVCMCVGVCAGSVCMCGCVCVYVCIYVFLCTELNLGRGTGG